ncbi:MAG: 7-cyano-7-deazaguanine synthase [Candidatus Aenigmatarchaeota archaeon]
MTENNEKTVCLVSGGIDSPVAAAMVSEKKEVVPLHFVLYPYYSEETFAISMRTLSKLEKVVNFSQIALFPWKDVMEKIFTSLEEKEKKEYACILCRKSMFKAAELVCDKADASSITTGESLGQKASQTLENLETTSYGVKYPINRPLMSLDKEEIVRKSKEMGLYMRQHAGCCNLTPDKPRTQSNPEDINRLFQEIGLGELIEKEAEKIDLIDTGETDIYEIFHSRLKELV